MNLYYLIYVRYSCFYVLIIYVVFILLVYSNKSGNIYKYIYNMYSKKSLYYLNISKVNIIFAEYYNRL